LITLYFPSNNNTKLSHNVQYSKHYNIFFLIIFASFNTFKPFLWPHKSQKEQI